MGKRIEKIKENKGILFGLGAAITSYSLSMLTNRTDVGQVTTHAFIGYTLKEIGSRIVEKFPKYLSKYKTLTELASVLIGSYSLEAVQTTGVLTIFPGVSARFGWDDVVYSSLGGCLPIVDRKIRKNS